MHWPVLDAVQAACNEIGLPSRGRLQPRRQPRRRRASTSTRSTGGAGAPPTAFCKPVLIAAEPDARHGRARRPRLVRRHARDRRVWSVDGIAQRASAAREVVLAAGALGSPQILMRSGIGPAEHLREHGIATKLDRPGVGANLHDHLQIGLRYRIEGARTLNAAMNSRLAQAGMALRYAFTRRGPLTMAPCQIGLFARFAARGRSRRPRLERARLLAPRVRRALRSAPGPDDDRLRPAPDQPRPGPPALDRPAAPPAIA